MLCWGIGDIPKFVIKAMNKRTEKNIRKSGRSRSDREPRSRGRSAPKRGLQKGDDNLLRTLIDAIPDIVFFKDSAGRHLIINKAGEELLGLSEEDIRGKTVEDILPPDVAAYCRKNDESVLTGKQPVRKEEHAADKSGKGIIFDMIRVPLYDDDGDAVGLVGLGRNITERKASEELLRHSEENFRHLFESANDAIFILDMKGNFIDVNKTAHERLGYTKEEMLSMNISRLDPPEYAARIPERLAQIEGLGMAVFESAHVKKDGTLMQVEVNSRVTYFKGEKVFLSVIRDITKRKQIEEELKFRNILLSTQQEASIDGILVVDEHGRIISHNRRFAEMWRVPPEALETASDELVLQAVLDMLVDPERFRERVIYLYSHRDETSREEIELVDGRTFDRYSAPIFSPDGKYYGRVWYFRDITDRKSAEKELMRHREHLEELVAKRTEEMMKAAHLASIGELAAGVAHEINNPINGIINYAQLLENRLDDGGREKEIARRIVKEGDRIAEIVKGLLSFARQRTHARSPVRVRNILSETLAITGAQLEKDGITLKKDVPHDLPEVIVNFQQIQQVFLNILNNARYALNEKYPRGHENKILEITGDRVVVNGMPCVRVIFNDCGTGIPSGIIDKIINPFFTTKPGDTGTGLGLSISHGIVKDHGGNIGIESSEGAFTRVIIDLPANGTADKKDAQ